MYDNNETHINITPDWSHSGTPKQLEERILAFQFLGSGFYILNDGNTLLVLPHADGRYTLNYYAGRNIGDDLNQAINLPVRRDDR
jgi:hypothetical protein